MENNISTAIPEEIKSPALDDQANQIIKRHAMLATGAGLIPIFGLDIAAVSAVQVRMVQQLAELYGISHEDHQLRIIVSSGVGSVFSRLTSYGISEVLHPFESLGNVADELTNAAISGLFTAASGEIYKIHFQKGLSFDTLDFSHYYDYFKEQIEEGNLSPNMFKNISSGFSYLMK